ncbi:Do family serine endopeptidase [Planctomycetes bacterium K23_9]|uniref:Periplasmic serine endoprotease DegP n=1 Tax=Stieleria marina TaxID=1930275 RepID=A0A517NXT5_9BACT|nr:Periplasmic serine endoprotease DegP precursor [Planctomycetes bacterium K23_9]
MKISKTSQRAAFFAAPLTLVAAGLLMAATPAINAVPAKPVTPPISAEQLNVANSLSQAFRNVADRVLPSVVAIENRPDTSWHSAKPSPDDGAMNVPNPFKGTPLEDMFRGGQIPMHPGMTPRQSPRSQGGIGSGVIIDAEAGIVLTNNHVVEGGGKVIVKTQDGREFEAIEVFTDPKTDIAVVKINGDSSLTAAKIGNSDATSVGDWVVALGQPFGLESTVTAGIVSAKNRGIGITDRENFIQTDAAINPGNSGGPLVNLYGEVIGINTAISSRGGGNNGVGFAVPSNLAQWVSNQLVANGTVQRAYLGVAIQPVGYDLANQLGVAPKGGVAVTNVFPDTPAAKTGFKSGDVIVKFGETKVSTPQQLQLAVERSPMGKPVSVEVVRDGKTITLSYAPEAAPSDFAGNGKSKAPSGMKMSSLGIEVSTLTADVAKQLGVQEESGVVITQVQDGSRAQRAGLKPGMVVSQVNRQDVKSAADFDKVVKADEDGTILMLVRSEQGSRFVVIEG